MNRAISVIKDEIVRFNKCTSERKVINHKEYVLGMIDLAVHIKVIDSETAKKLVKEADESKKQQQKVIGTREGAI